jgi:hypothetical protein
MAQLKARPQTYVAAAQFLGDRDSVKLGNNTYLERVTERVYEDGKMPQERTVIAVRLHNTQIVRFYEDGTKSLHTGGWQTVTTKDRLNEFCGNKIFQQKRCWYYGSIEVPFYEGMLTLQS